MALNIHELIKSEYERKQKRALDEIQRRKNEVYEKNPRLRSIEDEINITGVKYNKMILNGSDPADKVLTNLKSKIDGLKRERTLLLAGLGYPENYLEPSYECMQCHDTGFMEQNNKTQKCSCYRQQQINLLFSLSNLQLSKGDSFEAFNEYYYPDVANEEKYGIKKSPREQILWIKENCQKFIENFDSPDEKNLFFCGPTGTGKTFLANCIAIEIMKKGYTALYQCSSSLFSTIYEYRTKAYKDEYFEDIAYKNIFDVELLIIDDLGTESPTATRYAELLNIINIRQSNNISRPCKTIISTNINLKGMYEYYDERIVSRIIGNFNVFRFAGDDIRKIKTLSTL